jgi:serine/threonine protein kinase
VRKGLEPQLRRVFELLEGHQPLYSLRVPNGAPELLFLRGPHYDGCLFKPSAPVSSGGNGRFLVGMTPYKHPVAVKMMGVDDESRSNALQNNTQIRLSHFAREAYLTRGAGFFDIMHLFNTEQNQYMVMPLFNGDLQDHARAFFSLVAPPGPAGARQNGLFGARYVLRHLVAAVRELHERGVVHEDIKARNIFLQSERRKLVLGDLGIASVLEDNDQAQLRGYTPTFAAPEQFETARKHIDPKVDIFGLATTILYLLTTECPPVRAYRREHFPQQSVAGIFAYHRDVLRLPFARREMLFQALDGSSYRSGTKMLDPIIQSYQDHFRSIHESVNHFDFPLGALLRQMLQYSPAKRPRAVDIGVYMDEKLTVDDGCIQQVNAAWATRIPRFSAVVEDRIRELETAVDRLFPNMPQGRSS